MSDHHENGRRYGVKGCVAWLHARAEEMNDPHAKTILNTAAFNMGTTLRAWAPPEADEITRLQQSLQAVEADRERLRGALEEIGSDRAKATMQGHPLATADDWTKGYNAACRHHDRLARSALNPKGGTGSNHE